jgi:hypothetical protein
MTLDQERVLPECSAKAGQKDRTSETKKSFNVQDCGGNTRSLNKTHLEINDF